MSTAIKIENLSKRYVIGHKRQDRYTTFREVLMHKIRGAGQRIRHPLSPNQEEMHQEELWALRNIDLEISQGDRIGIIGNNGAGKSTLLKVLSRITEPTRGRFTMNGRVASLLEVGTGFHAELSGRENIYLNGAILGMSKLEIRKKFDEIVAFAEIERFLDTPVKRYSSGMYVRLAFAVAAHLEPEILIVDEVLAVGDAAFQRKCLGKMKEIGGQGRTVLFVSHNMGSIRALCESAIVIKSGRMEAHGNVNDVVAHYLGRENEQTPANVVFESISDKNAQICQISIKNLEGNLASISSHDQKLCIHIDIQVNKKIPRCYLALQILDKELQIVLFSRYFITDEQAGIILQRGRHHYVAEIPAPLLVPGAYSLTVHLMSASPPIKIDGAECACAFEIVDAGSDSAKHGMGWHGYISTPLNWSEKTV